MVYQQGRWLAGLSLSVCCIAVGSLSGCDRFKVEPGKPSPFEKAFAPDARQKVEGLQAPVDIVRDRWGVPHVYAATDEDLSMAMGYLHAQDRLFLMDALRHIASGRLAEYLGKGALRLDVGMRQIMMAQDGRPVSQLIYEKANPKTKRLLQAYSRGVNQYLRELREGRWKLPPGYAVPALASLTPTDIPDWEPTDTIATGRLQELGLSAGTGQDDLERGQWISRLSPQRFADLARFAPANPTVVLPDWLSSLGRLLGQGRSASSDTPDLRRWNLGRALDQVKFAGQSSFSRQQRGSNNWVIGGAHTQSGYPIVANDPHLDFTTPSTFYHAHLNTKLLNADNKGLDAIGVTTPGSPDIVLGHNQDVAWGGTMVGWDVTDVYLEKLNEQGSATLFQGQMVPILRVPQTFKLGPSKDAPSVEQVIEYVPHHGPIVSKDVENKSAVTVKWTGRLPSMELHVGAEVSRSQNIETFMAAIGGYTVFAQNWNAADRHGALGYTTHTQVPIRASIQGACRPYLPMDGTGPCEWVGMIPADQLPSKVQDGQGWLVTANNDVVGQLVDNDPGNDPAYLHSDRALGFRAGRITQVIQGWIQSGQKISVQDVIGLQGDVHSLLAQRVLPHLFAAVQADPERVKTLELSSALERLRAWDFQMAAGTSPSADAVEIDRSIAASIFSMFMVKLAEQTLGDELAQAGVELPGNLKFKTLLMLLDTPEQKASDESYWDNLNTQDKVETQAEILFESLRAALATLASKEAFSNPDPQTWRWGQLHKMQILDPTAMFTGQPLRTQGPFARQGGNFTVDVASQSGLTTDFSFRAGPQMRFVAELRPEGPVALNALPGGQSDDPDSPHYDDLLKRWLGNETFPYYFKLQDVIDNKEQYLRWEPAS